MTNLERKYAEKLITTIRIKGSLAYPGTIRSMMEGFLAVVEATLDVL